MPLVASLVVGVVQKIEEVPQGVNITVANSAGSTGAVATVFVDDSMFQLSDTNLVNAHTTLIKKRPSVDGVKISDAMHTPEKTFDANGLISVLSNRVTTPTNKDGLSKAQILDTTRFPGLNLMPFVGGAVKIACNFDTDRGVLEAKYPPFKLSDGVILPTGNGDAFELAGIMAELSPTVEIEPATESSIAGMVINMANGHIFLSGGKNNPPIEIVPMPQGETRVPALDMQTDTGFSVDYNKLLERFNAKEMIPASAEGYFSETDKKFYAYDIQIVRPIPLIIPPSGTPPTLAKSILASDSPQISIVKAQARNRLTMYDINIRGYVTMMHDQFGSQQISVYRMDSKGNEVLLGNAVARGARKVMERWEFTGSFALTPEMPLAPYVIRVKNMNPKAIAENGGKPVEAIEFHVEIIKG